MMRQDFCNIHDGITPMTPLMAAVQQIHIPIVQCLLQAQAQINGPLAPQGTTPVTTPLYYAAQTGSIDLVQLLCQHMANVRSTSNTGDEFGMR